MKEKYHVSYKCAEYVKTACGVSLYLNLGTAKSSEFLTLHNMQKLIAEDSNDEICVGCSAWIMQSLEAYWRHKSGRLVQDS